MDNKNLLIPVSDVGHVIRLGYYSALAAAIFTILWAALALAFPSPAWEGISAYAKGFATVQIINTIPAMMIMPSMIMLIAALHSWAPPSKRVFTTMGLMFTSVYAAIIASNYFLQLQTVRLNLIGGNLEGLSLLALPNLRSAFFALDVIGYGFLSFAAIVVCPIFTGNRLHSWIRWLLIVVGVIGVFGMVIAPLDLPLVVLAGSGLWAIVFPAVMVLIAIMFKKHASAQKM